MNDSPRDQLLEAIDQFANAVYWHQDRSGIAATTALTEALQAWIADRTTTADGTVDDLDHAFDAMRALVGQLTDRQPNISIGTAMAEAVGDWAAAEAAEHNQSQPFTPHTGTY